MKIRLNFVPNSSSASFILQRNKMTEDQVIKILQYQYTAKELDVAFYDRWNIYDDGEFIRGDTIMDNGDMGDLFEALELPDTAVVHYEGDG